jgi:hypothetical protein
MSYIPNKILDANGEPINSVLDVTTRRLAVDAKAISASGQEIKQNGYMAETGLLTLSESNEQNFLLLKNPSGSGKTVNIYRFIAGVDEGQTGKSTAVAFYRNPTISSNGTAIAIRPVAVGYATSAVAQIYKAPTISNRNQRLLTTTYGTNLLYDTGADFHLQIAPGENLLITLDPTATNQEHFVSLIFFEK